MTKYADPQPTVQTAACILAMPPSEASKLDAERAMALQSARDGLAFTIEFYQIDAKLKRAKYLALIREGFTPQEALILCKP